MGGNGGREPSGAANAICACRAMAAEAGPIAGLKLLISRAAFDHDLSPCYLLAMDERLHVNPRVR